ncbi:hypothetical protein ACHAWF_008202 [Thalassiosira exigua]
MGGPIVSSSKQKKTDYPTSSPTSPTVAPSVAGDIVDSPSSNDVIIAPTESPSLGTDRPSYAPSASPTDRPSSSPTASPSTSARPTSVPSSVPTASQLPSAFPTAAPSSAPSANPSAIPTVQPSSSAMPSMAPIPYTRTARVEIRSDPWSALAPEIQTSAQRLGYDEANWNAHGGNEIENLNWERLTADQKDDARTLGYDEYTWDCWQNHFQSYRFIDLDNPYIQAGQWWKQLGWDIWSWNKMNPPPASDSTTWYELSPDEREAAAQLCYSRTSWDEVEPALIDGFPIERPEFRYRHWMNLNEDVRDVASERLKYSPLSWNVLGLGVIETRDWARLTDYEAEAALSIGFTQLAWDCWQNHFRGYSWDDLAFYGLDIPYMALGWTELSWDGEDTTPASQGLTWKELSQEEREVASELCYFRDNWDGIDMTPNSSPFPFPMVKQRYVKWSSLDPSIRQAARDSLSYTKNSWNNLGSAQIESLSWGELTKHQRSDAFTLGFYQRTWDCFQNHYRGYEWEELSTDSQDALQVFGWSQTSWEKNEEPPSYNNTWDRLSENEQSVATDLCFFEDNWNGNNLEVIAADLLAEYADVPEEVNVTNVTTPNQDPESISSVLNPGDSANNDVVSAAVMRHTLIVVSVIVGGCLLMMI